MLDCKHAGLIYESWLLQLMSFFCRGHFFAEDQV